MLIAGMQKCSLVDYPGKAAVTVFTPGCNLRCYWCHNYDALVAGGGQSQPRISEAEVFAFLRKRQGLISAVVVTGGEPTLHLDLADFLRKVRDMGFAVKLDTNGGNPDHLAAILAAGLVDYVAMDQKAPREKIAGVTGIKTQSLPDAFAASRDLIRQSGVDYEFRTTVLPEFTVADIVKIGRTIRGAKRYALQQYRQPACLASSQDSRLTLPPHEAAFFHECAKEMSGWFDDLLLRGVEKIRLPAA